MPVTPPTLASAIRAAAPELQGPDWIRLTLAVASAVSAWSAIPSNVTLNGVTTGAAGGGAVTGKITVPPVPGPVLAAFTANGLVGPNAASVARAVGVGVATAFSTEALYQGASVGVGSGTDISKITVANPATLTTAITAAMGSAGMVGADAIKLSTAIGTGVSALLLTGTGIGGVAGPVGPAPGVGTSVSHVL